MSNARDKANIPSLNFSSTGIDDNATSTAITIDSNNNVAFLDGTGSLPSITNSGDKNTGIYFPSADTLGFSTGGSERMRIDTSGNVGIGTSSPSTSLHISQSVPIITLTDTDTSVSHQLSGQSGSRHLNLKVDTGGSSGSPVFNLSMQDSIKLSVLNDGNVGIGTSSPVTPLNVIGGSDLGIEVSDTSSGGNGVITIKGNATNGGSYLQFGDTDDDNVGRIYYTHNDNAMKFNTNDAERMRIDSSGNVGIGTTSPETKLHVFSASSGASAHVNGDDLFIENSGACGITIGSGATSVGTINFADSSAQYDGYIEYNHANRNMRFATAVSSSGEAMRILENGRIGINRSSVNGAAQLDISHPGSSEYGLTLDSSNTAGTQYHLDIRRGGTQAGYLTSNSATTVVLNNASDERLKENIQNSNSAIQDLKDIQVRQFDWIDNIDTHRDFGFVAQELINVVPEAVTRGTDTLDANGKPVQSWGVDYSHIVPRLVKVCQEQQTKIEDLEARILALETTP